MEHMCNINCILEYCNVYIKRNITIENSAMICKDEQKAPGTLMLYSLYMTKLKRTGDMGDPCGIPDVVLIELERQPSNIRMFTVQINRSNSTFAKYLLMTANMGSNE